MNPLMLEYCDHSLYILHNKKKEIQILFTFSSFILKKERKKRSLGKLKSLNLVALVCLQGDYKHRWARFARGQYSDVIAVNIASINICANMHIKR